MSSKRRMSQEKYEQKIADIISNEQLPFEYLYMEDYIGNKTKITMYCNLHNEQFTTSINNFLTRHSGCLKCSNHYHYSFKDRLNQVKDRINKEKLPYVIVKENQNNYKNQYSKITLHCNDCNKEWQVSFGKFLNKKTKCPTCTPYRKRYTAKERENQIVNIINSEHLNYTYIGMKDSYKEKASFTRIRLYCNDCRCEWNPSINCFVNSSTRCPHCNKSNGESRIANFLINNDIKFYREHRFKGCKYKHQLPFDFYLYEHNMCIEFDGIQHFQPVKFGGKNDSEFVERFEETCIKDNVKNQFCLKNNIKLIRLKYDETDEQIQKKILNEINLKDVKCEEILKA